MTIVKQAVGINFLKGLDTKTDPWQVQLGNFLALENSIFTKGGMLNKRNGYAPLSSLPNDSAVYLTTLGGNMTALGSAVYAYSGANASWVNKGSFQPLSFSTLPVARSAINQIQCDSVVAENGLVCTVYTELNNSTAAYYYKISDSVTGQNIVNPTLIPVSSGTVTGSPRVFLLGNYFIVAFANVITAVTHLQYIAISTTSPSTVVRSNTDISSNIVNATTVAWDAVMNGQKLFFAYNTASGGQQVAIKYLTSSLSLSTAQSFAGSIATMMSMCADTTNAASPVIYASFYDAGGSTGSVIAVDQNLNKLMTDTQIIPSGTVFNITCAAQSGVVTSIYELSNNYSYDSAIVSHILKKVSVTLPATVTTGTAGSTTTLLRSLGLASKAFIMGSTIYVLSEYASSLQPTYFLTDISGNIVSRFAYQNGGASLSTSTGYLPVGLPQAQVSDSSVYIAYLFKDLIQTQNTSGLNPTLGQVGTTNVYSQTGVNLATIDFSSDNLGSSEIGSNLNITGGLLWSYDGQSVVEQGFNVFPDNVECTWSATGGSIHAQPDGSTNTNAYYYRVIYQWTDAAGNIVQSAPSLPVAVTTTSNGTSGSITVNVPTLRLTYKTDVKIIIYRWSVANQIFYQVTSITAPTLNSKTVDSIAYVDTLADASIVGNSIIYTTGGVIEDIAGPAASAVTLFDDRLWLVDAEDRNLLWYSKQVIEATPVEMSDLLTIFVAPTVGAQGSTGPITAIAPMDDKLIIFKRDAIYYLNGTGPDNTGANSQYSQPIFITSTVGCSNPKSIVFMPGGLMFQSDKGIWLLGRDLSTNYIGAPVEAYNSYTVNSSVNVPGTNQVRFTLSSGVILMYDYYYQQWGVFSGVPAISSTLYQNLHTYLGPDAVVSQETEGQYLDNGNPVLLKFTTSWIAVAGLQGYQRAFFFYLLGAYYSPHKLNLSIAYDYNPSPTQNTIISPNNFGPVYGSDSMPVYGDLSPYGGGSSDSGASSNIEQWRVFLNKQRCTSFQITLQEIYDPSLGAPAGQGLSLSGLNLVVAVKRGFRTQPAATSAGTVSA